MTELLAAFVAGGALAAAITGVFSLILYKVKKRDDEDDQQDNFKRALRYLMLYAIQERAEKYLVRGSITVDERRALHKWHDLYHNGLDGNGDADALMSDIDNLPLKI